MIMGGLTLKCILHRFFLAIEVESNGYLPSHTDADTGARVRRVRNINKHRNNSYIVAKYVKIYLLARTPVPIQSHTSR